MPPWLLIGFEVFTFFIAISLDYFLNILSELVSIVDLFFYLGIVPELGDLSPATKAGLVVFEFKFSNGLSNTLIGCLYERSCLRSSLDISFFFIFLFGLGLRLSWRRELYALLLTVVRAVKFTDFLFLETGDSGAV